MGQYFRKWLEDEGLFPENYQPEEEDVRIYANAKQRTVATDEDEVDTPRVDTDAGQRDAAVGHLLQSAYHFKIQGVDVPIEVAARLYQIVRKPREFLLLQPSVAERTQYGPSARCTEVYSKVILFLVCHIRFV